MICCSCQSNKYSAVLSQPQFFASSSFSQSCFGCPLEDLRCYVSFRSVQSLVIVEARSAHPEVEPPICFNLYFLLFTGDIKVEFGDFEVECLIDSKLTVVGDELFELLSESGFEKGFGRTQRGENR